MSEETLERYRKKPQSQLDQALEKADQETIQKVEYQDQSQMRDEILGKTIGEFIYDFKVGSRRVVGLTYAGVVQAARSRGDIKVSEIKVKESSDGTAYEAEVTAIDTKKNFEIKAVARQPKTFSNGTPNEFAYTVAASKATRNALRRLLPEEYIKNVVDTWLKKREQDKKDARSFM